MANVRNIEMNQVIFKSIFITNEQQKKTYYTLLSQEPYYLLFSTLL